MQDFYVEKLLIASFKDPDGNYQSHKESCKNLKKKYNGRSGFSNSQCINWSDPESECA